MIEIHNYSTNPNEIQMKMTDGDQTLCTACATLQDGVAEITCLAEEEPMLRYDMGKALLNAIDLAGAEQAVCRNKELHAALTALRFAYDQQEQLYRLSLPGYFCASCHPEEEVHE